MRPYHRGPTKRKAGLDHPASLPGKTGIIAEIMIGWTVGGGARGKGSSARRAPHHSWEASSDMEADVVRIWATPSTLHLRLIIRGGRKQWMRSMEIHCPWENLAPGERQRLREALDDGRSELEEDQEQLGLFESPRAGSTNRRQS